MQNKKEAVAVFMETIAPLRTPMRSFFFLLGFLKMLAALKEEGAIVGTLKMKSLQSRRMIFIMRHKRPRSSIEDR